MENVHKGFEKYNCDECVKISYKILDWSCSWRKGFKLKVYIQNVHGIEKIRYKSINDIMDMISTFRNIQNSNVKFVKRNY